MVHGWRETKLNGEPLSGAPPVLLSLVDIVDQLTAAMEFAFPFSLFSTPSTQ